MRPHAMIAVTALLLLTAAPAAGAPPGSPERRHCDKEHGPHALALACMAPNGGAVRADFNGDGRADLAIGVPAEDIGTVVNAGVVHVQYSASATFVKARRETLQQGAGVDASEPGDELGAALASGDWDGDGIADLAIGAPGEDGERGAVYLWRGSTSGLVATADVLSGLQAGDRFGAALAFGRFGGSAAPVSLAVGAPFEDRGANDAGAVHVHHRTPSGQVTASSYGQADPEVEGTPGQGDRFGHALAAADLTGDGADDLAAGAPGEGNDGAVNVLYGSAAGGLTTAGDQVWTLGTAREPGPGYGPAGIKDSDFGAALAAGDFNADGRGDLAIGAPGAFAGSHAGAGVVVVLRGSGTGLVTTGAQTWSQAVSALGDSTGTDDRFGSALSARDFNGDNRADLAIGVPFEGAYTNTGVVHVLYGTVASGLATQGAQRVTRSALTGAPGGAQDRFGAALTWGDYNGDGKADLAIGAPGATVDGQPRAGAVHTVPGGLSGLNAGGALQITQGGFGETPEADDGFGSALY